MNERERQNGRGIQIKKHLLNKICHKKYGKSITENTIEEIEREG